MSKKNTASQAFNAAAVNVKEFLLYVTTGDMAMMRMELKSNPGLANIADEDGMPALHHAVSWGQEDAVALLLKAGANPKATDSRGETAGNLALRLNFTRLAERIFQQEQIVDFKIAEEQRKAAEAAALKDAIGDFASGTRRDIAVDRPRYPWEK